MTKLKAIACIAAGAIMMAILGNTPEERPSANTASSPTSSTSSTGSDTGTALSTQEYTSEQEEWLARTFNPPDTPLEVAKVVETQHGTFDVIEVSESEQQVRFNGDPIAITSRTIGLGRLYRLANTDLVPLSMSSGDPACPTMFMLLIVDDKDVRASKSFGDCTEFIRVTPRGRRLVLRIGESAFLADAHGVQTLAVSEAIDEEAAAALEAEIDNASADGTNIFRPLLKPDMKVYRWCGLLEQATPLGAGESDFTFGYVVKVGNYRFAATSSQDADDLRIGGLICVTGRYVGNMELETVIGAHHTTPLLAALRVSSSL